jgi:ABC-type spermidine/putrescine transport system permease subunit I
VKFLPATQFNFARNTGRTMKKAQDKFTEVGLVSLAGLILLGIVFFAPNGNGESAAAFYQAAFNTTWQRLLDWPAAWSSLKLILLSLGLFLLIDAFGTFLLAMNRRRWAGKVFILIFLPFIGCLVGGFYLVKSLL